MKSSPDFIENKPGATIAGIQSILSSIQSTIAALVKPIIPKDPEKIQNEELTLQMAKDLKTYVIENTAINQAFNRIAVLCLSDPRNSFKEVTKFFFKIPLTPSIPLTTTKLPQTHWITRLSIKNSNIYGIRVVLFHIVENYIADIVYRIVCTAKDNIDISFLIEDYFSEIVASISDNFSAQILIEMCDKFELIIHKLSQKYPKMMWDWTVNFISSKTTLPLTKIFVYKSLRSITVENVPKEDIESKNAIESFQNILSSFETPQILTDGIIATSLFVTAIIAELLISRKENNLTTTIFNSIMSQNGQRYSAFFPLLCTFYVMKDETRSCLSIGQLLSNARRFARQSNNSEELIFYGLKRILCGPKYLPHCEEDSEVTLQWRTDRRDFQELTHFFPILMQCSSLESTSSSELAGFLTQLAINLKNEFVEQYLPELQSSNFMEENGIAVFEVGRRLLPMGDNELINKYTDLCINLISEFGSSERTKSVPGIPTDVCEVDKLYETSAPIIPTTISQKKMMTDVNQLQKAISPESKKALNYGFKIELKLNQDCVMPDSPLARCLSIVPLLGFSEKLTSCVISRIYDKSAFISSLAARSLMMLAKKYPNKTTHIISLIMSQSAKINEHLYIVIKVLEMIFNVVKGKQNIEELTEAVAPIIIVGLCSTSYEVRGETLNLLDLTSAVKFFENNNKKITTLTLKKIASVFVSDCDAGVLQQLTFQSFREFAAAKYEVIYHIYLSVVFSLLPLSKEFKYFHTSNRTITTLFKKLSQTLAKESKEYALETINIATYLIATSDTTTTDNDTLFKIMSGVIPIINDLITSEPFDVILYSFAASVDKEHTLMMLKLLTGPNELYLRTFAFVAHLYVMNNDITSNADAFNCLLNYMSTIVQYCDSTSLISNTSIEPVKEMSPLMTECIISFSHVIEIICKQFNRINSAPAAGPFLHNPNPKKLMNRSNWFYFMFNLDCLPETFPEKLRQATKDAFAAFCSVNAIPDDLFQIFISHILKIAPQNTLACSYILSHAFGYFLEHFIDNSINESHFFSCIALRFPDPRSIYEDAQILASAAQKPLSSKEQSFADSVFAHLGDLIALCLIFLSGDRPGLEKDAQKVLYNIILSGTLLCDSPNLSKAIDYIKETSFMSLLKLSGILSDAFSFCAEQFIARSLSIIDGQNSLMCFTCLIEPWFKHVDLSTDNSKLIPETTHVFQSFTNVSFMHQFIRVVCQPPLQPPSISLLEAIINNNIQAAEFIFVYCFSAYTELKEQCKAVLLYICKKYKEIALKAASFLKFKYWWYSVIKLRTFDQFFDFDKFLSLMQSDNNQESTTTQADPNIYQENTMFALDICCELLQYYEEIRPLIISFCITQPRTEVITQALIIASGLEEPTVDDIKRVVKDNLNIFFSECFNWATTCGDIKIALEAAKYAIQTVKDSNTDMIYHILRSLKLITDTLCENSTPFDQKKQAKHITKVIQKDTDFNIKLYYKHIACLLALLCKVCKETKTSNAQILNTLCEFSSCGETEYQPIFESFVNATYSIMNIPNNIKNTEVSGGILIKIAEHNLFIEKKKAKSIIEQLFNLTALMFNDNLFDFIFPRSTKFVDVINQQNGEIETKITQDMQVSAILVWLIPFIATDCTDQMLRSFESISNTVLHIDIISIWQYFKGNNEENVSELTKTISTLAHRAGPVLTSAIIKIYSLIINHTSKYSHAIYAVASSILETTKTPNNLSMKRIALPALKEKDESCSFQVSRFLTLYSERCIDFDPLPGFKVSIAFPVKKLCESLPKRKKDELPLYLTECSFFYFSVIEAARDECINVPVSPFDEWAMLLFNSESQRVTLASPIGVVPEVTSELINHFINTINNKMDLDSRTEEKMRSRSQSISESSKKEDENSFLLVPDTVFLPTTDYINELGFDITGNLF